MSSKRLLTLSEMLAESSHGPALDERLQKSCQEHQQAEEVNVYRTLVHTRRCGKRGHQDVISQSVVGIFNQLYG